MEPLTDIQKAVLEFIRERVADGSPPTVREIQTHFGWASPSTAHQHVEALRRKGHITAGDGALARSLRVESALPVKRVVGIPLLGAIPAGHGDLRFQDPDGMVHYDLESLKLPAGARVFALKVTGDSMTGKHIQDGDIVILEQGADPRAGEVVAALVDGHSTLKTFIRDKGRTWLRAENPRYPDLIPAGELMIQGVLRMVVRDTSAKKHGK